MTHHIWKKFPKRLHRKMITECNLSLRLNWLYHYWWLSWSWSKVLNYYQIIFVCNNTWKRYLATVWKRKSTPKILLCSFSLNGHAAVGKWRSTDCKFQILLKTQWHLFSVNKLCSLHNFKYMRQRQKSQKINNMRPPKRAPITMTKVAKSYKNSSTKWLFCHSILGHTSPYAFTNWFNLFRPHVNCMY